jgi:EpsI family protein
VSQEGARAASLTRRGFVIGAALAGASGVAFARLPKPDSAAITTKALDSAVPKKIGPWVYASESGLVLPPRDALSDRLYDNLITRVYTAPQAPAVMLLIAYNNMQDGVVQAHRPEVCYPAGGYQITPTSPVAISRKSADPIPANVFTAVGPDRTEQVLYWTRMGANFPRSWAQQRLALAQSNLSGVIPDGALVRVSLIAEEMPSAVVQLKTFVSELVYEAPPLLRRVLTGL